MKLKNVKLKEILKEAFQHLSGKHFWMLKCVYIQCIYIYIFFLIMFSIILVIIGLIMSLNNVNEC